MKRNAPLETEFQDRLLPLCDGRRGLRGSIAVDIREPAAADLSPSPGGEGRLPAIAAAAKAGSEGAPSSTLDVRPQTLDPSCPILDFISSDETLDRYDEIISASRWRLDNYRRNPV